MESPLLYIVNVIQKGYNRNDVKSYLSPTYVINLVNTCIDNYNKIQSFNISNIGFENAKEVG